MSYSNLGGRGKTNILKSSCDVIVTTPEELIIALQTPDQKIWINNNLNLSAFRMINIPEGTTLCSNGKTIKALSFYLFPRGEALLFTTTGPNIRISGIKFVGCNGEILDQDWSKGFQGLIKVNHNNFTFENCKVLNFDTWGIWVNNSDNCQIYENTFSNIRRDGYGYSIWVGGYRTTTVQETIIERNIFLNTRHAIGSSGHLNDVIANYNLVDGTSSKHNFDRHNDTIHCYGGAAYIMIRNIFLAKNRHFGLQLPTEGEVIIYNNYFYQPETNVGHICDTPAHLDTSPQVTISNNFYNGEAIPIPIQPPILPLPDPTLGQRLSFKYKDSYTGNKFNKYKIQVIHNNTIIWKKDIKGNGKTWNTCNIPISGPGEIKIRFLCVNPTDVVSATLWLDDIQLDQSFTNFEDKSYNIWTQRLTPKPPDADQISSGIKTDDAYSGYFSYTMSFDVTKTYQPGQYCELYTIYNG